MKATTAKASMMNSSMSVSKSSTGCTPSTVPAHSIRPSAASSTAPLPSPIRRLAPRTFRPADRLSRRPNTNSTTTCRSYPPPHDPEAYEREMAPLRETWSQLTESEPVGNPAEVEVEARLAANVLDVPPGASLKVEDSQGKAIEVQLPQPARYAPVHTFYTPDHHPCTVLVASDSEAGSDSSVALTTRDSASPEPAPEKREIIDAAALARRRYSLWHEDSTGDRTLWIGANFEPKRGLYAGMMRDEVYAVWHVPGEDVGKAELHVHCSVTSSVLGEGPTYEKILAALGSNLLRHPDALEALKLEGAPDPYREPHEFWKYFARSQRALQRSGSQGLRSFVQRLSSSRWAISFLLLLRELEDSMALFRKKIFEYHMPEALYAVILGDRAVLESFPHLREAPVYIHYHARPGQSSQAQMVYLGTAQECVQGSIKKNEHDPEAHRQPPGARLSPLAVLKDTLKKARRARQEVGKVWSEAMVDLAGIQERCFYVVTVGAARLLADIEGPLKSVTASLSSLGGSLSGSMDEDEGDTVVGLWEGDEAEADDGDVHLPPEPVNIFNYLPLESALLLASLMSTVAISDMQLGKVVGGLLVAGLIQLP